MCSTILIISDKQRRGPSKKASKQQGHVKMLFAGSMADAQEWIAGEAVDLTLIALKGPDDETFALVRQSLEKNQETRVMFFANDEELNGTLSALAKFPPEQLKKIISPKAISGTTRTVPFTRRENAVSASSHETSGLFNEHELIGISPEIERIKLIVLKLAPVGTTIMLQGEKGTGKKVIARTIHNHSSRKNEVFIPVDCASIDENRIESELFGYNKEVPADAGRNSLGLIRSAERGTLFLDSIAELPIAVQTKILRTIIERRVKPLGSSKTYPVDIRIIAASNTNLADAVKNGTFCQDLYDHLHAITLYVHPLRERRTDIPILCTYFINKLFYEGYPKKQLSDSAMTALCNYEWPGNIRELENVIRGALILSDGRLVELCDLSFSDKNN
jgi:two-component system, NtrC family, response regulator HydG